jgi:hypothetical protein
MVMHVVGLFHSIDRRDFGLRPARLSFDELLANALLLAAGNETTTCVLGNGL